MRLSHKFDQGRKLTQRGADILISALRIDSCLDEVPHYRFSKSCLALEARMGPRFCGYAQ
jgi:hypothetical protein